MSVQLLVLDARALTSSQVYASAFIKDRLMNLARTDRAVTLQELETCPTPTIKLAPVENLTIKLPGYTYTPNNVPSDVVNLGYEAFTAYQNMWGACDLFMGANIFQPWCCAESFK